MKKFNVVLLSAGLLAGSSLLPTLATSHPARLALSALAFPDPASAQAYHDGQEDAKNFINLNPKGSAAYNQEKIDAYDRLQESEPGSVEYYYDKGYYSKFQ